MESQEGVTTRAGHGQQARVFPFAKSRFALLEASSPLPGTPKSPVVKEIWMHFFSLAIFFTAPFVRHTDEAFAYSFAYSADGAWERKEAKRRGESRAFQDWAFDEGRKQGSGHRSGPLKAVAAKVGPSPSKRWKVGESVAYGEPALWGVQLRRLQPRLTKRERSSQPKLTVLWANSLQSLALGCIALCPGMNMGASVGK